MWLKSLRTLLRSPTSSAGKVRRGRGSVYQLLVESLECRLVPATTTSIFLDVGAASPIIQASPSNTVKVFIDAGSLGIGAGGIASAQFYVKYDPTVLEINDLAVAPGATGSDIKFGSLFTRLPTALAQDYSLGVSKGAISGLVGVSITDTAGIFYTGTAGGQLVELDFHVLQSATFGVSTLVDLKPTSGSITNTTYVADAASTNYPLSPVPKSYTGTLTQTGVLAPSRFTPADTDVGDAAIQLVKGTPAVAPTAINDSYIMAGPAPNSAAVLPTTMMITGKANGVLANDTDSNGAINAFLVGTSTAGSTTINGVYTPTFTQATAHGSVTLNEADGSFSYTPTAGFVGLDSFSYTASDALSGTASAGPATVTIQVGSKISIPKTLTLGSPATTVVAPVMIDDPNPSGSGGLASVTIGINYDATKFTVSASDVTKGALPATAGWTQLAVTLPTPGQVVIVESGTPVTTTAPGSLAFITLHLISGTPSGTSLVNLSAAVPAASGLLGGQGGNPALALFPPPVDNPTLTSAGSADDGLITTTALAGKPTTTTVSTSSGAPTYGTAVTLTATVAAASGSVAPALGSVQFSVTNNGVSSPMGGVVSNDTTSGTNAIFTLVTSATALQAGQINALSAAYTPGTGFTGSSSTTSVNETVAPFTLKVTGITAGNKVYDATTKATLNTVGAALTGVVGGDAVTLSTAGATGTFASKDVGNGITVTVSGLTIAGAKAVDYALAQPTTTANITRAPLTITAATNTKIYDATVGAAAIPTILGLLGSDTVTGLNETYSTPNVGTGKTLAVSAGYTVNDGNNGGDYAVTTVTDTTGSIVPGPFSKFMVSVQGGDTVVAGNAFLLTAQATDAFGNPVSSYNGPSSITATASPADPQVNYSINAPVSGGGVAFFMGTLQTAGSYTLTAAGASTSIIVTPASASYFTVTAPASATTGTAFNLAVKAFDRFSNPATGYTGTVSITSTDSAAFVVSPNYTFVATDNGAHTFPVTLKSGTLASGIGTTVIVRDTTASPPIIGLSNSIAVQGLVVLPGASGFTPRPDGFTVTFSKPFTPADLTMYGLNLTTVQDVTLVGANGGNPVTIDGSIYLDPTNLNQMTFKASSEFMLKDNPDTVAALPDDTYTATLVSGTGSNGFVDALNTHLDGLGNGTAANWTTTFTTTYQDDAHSGASSTPILAIPDFSRGPDSSSTVTVPNNKTAPGIPVTLYSVKASVRDAAFTLVYNPDIYTPTGGGAGDAPAGSTFTMGTIATIDSAHSQVTFTYHNATGHTGTIVLGDILGFVPNSAASIYKTKGLLNPTAITITGGATVQPSAGLDVDAYLGDVHVTASPTIDASDAVDGQKVSSGAATGFTSYTLLDPAIVGGFIDQHTISVDTSDVTNLFTKAAHGTVPQLPNIPAAVTTVSVGGADPTVSLGDAVQVAGGIISVPVMLDDPDPVGSTGMTEAHLALTYDPSVLSIAPSDITLGSIPGLGAGWQITSEVDAATGQIGINLFNLARTPITSAQAGSLVNITFHIVSGATVPRAAVQLVSQATVNGQRTLTEVDDSQGPLTLNPVIETSYRRWPGLRYSEAPEASEITAHSEALDAFEASPRAGASEYLSPGHDSLTYESLNHDALTRFEINEMLAVVSNDAAVGQVFEFGAVPALNSLLYGNSPGQLAADQLFLDLGSGTEMPTDRQSPTFSSDDQQLFADRLATANKVFAQLADEMGD